MSASQADPGQIVVVVIDGEARKATSHRAGLLGLEA